jgi:ADP-ribosylation factor GTPase-activating protein 1
VASTLQTGTRNATEAVNRFVEGDEHHNAHPNAPKSGPDEDKLDFWDSFASAGEARMAEQEAAKKKKLEPERKDFWDEFASVGEQRVQQQQAKKSSTVGTAAMKRPGGGAGGAAGGTGKKDDEWEQW